MSDMKTQMHTAASDQLGFDFPTTPEIQVPEAQTPLVPYVYEVDPTLSSQPSEVQIERIVNEHRAISYLGKISGGVAAVTSNAAYGRIVRAKGKEAHAYLDSIEDQIPKNMEATQVFFRKCLGALVLEEQDPQSLLLTFMDTFGGPVGAPARDAEKRLLERKAKKSFKVNLKGMELPKITHEFSEPFA